MVLVNICLTQTYREIPDVVTKVGTSVGNWLKLETDARAVGMGGAQVAAGEGVSALSYNPASIAFFAADFCQILKFLMSVLSNFLLW